MTDASPLRIEAVSHGPILYVRLYGPRRTLVKIRGQYHKNRKFDPLPPCEDAPADAGRHVGLVGCGNYAYGVIAYYLDRNYGRVLRGAMDPDVERAASVLRPLVAR